MPPLYILRSTTSAKSNCESRAEKFGITADNFPPCPKNSRTRGKRSFAEEIFSEEEDFSFSALEELSDDEDFSVSHFTSQTSTMRFFSSKTTNEKELVSLTAI